MPNQYTDPLSKSERAKVSKGYCRVRFCRCKVLKNHSRCAKHQHERIKEINPVGYWYSVWKNNAKRRKKPFTLTRQEFEEFTKDTNYLKLKGKTKYSLSIDRIDNNEGYHKWNIRAITLQVNTWKMNYVDYGNRKEEECPY